MTVGIEPSEATMEISVVDPQDKTYRMTQLHHSLEHAQEIQHPTTQTTCSTTFSATLDIISGNGYKVCINRGVVKKNVVVVDVRIEILFFFKEKLNKILR